MPWLAALLTASAPRLSRFTAQGLTLIGDSLAQVGYQPPPSWIAAYVTALGAQLPHVPPSGAAQLLSIFGSLGYRPRTALGAALLGRVLRNSEHVPAKRWFPALLGAALLGLPLPLGTGGRRPFRHRRTAQEPGQSKGQAFLQVGEEQLPSQRIGAQMEGQGHVPQPQAPGSAWPAELLALSQQKYAHCRARNLAQLVWALVWLRQQLQVSLGPG